MKTKLLTVSLAAIASVIAFFPSNSQASSMNPSTPSWEQVGVAYGYYLENIYGSEDSSQSGLADFLAASLLDAYGSNVAYYFYFQEKGYEISGSIYEESYSVTSYYRYLANYYSYLYYWSPAYASQLSSYFFDYSENLRAQYESYADSVSGYYFDVADYYYDIIYPDDYNHEGPY